MTPFQFLLGTIFCISLAVGQILFKVAANQKAADGQPLDLMKVVLSLPMISACILYGLTIILYVFILQKVPLSRAYMFSVAGAAIVPFLAIAIFKEPYSPKYLVGLGLVLCGLIVSTSA